MEILFQRPARILAERRSKHIHFFMHFNASELFNSHMNVVIIGGEFDKYKLHPALFGFGKGRTSKKAGGK